MICEPNEKDCELGCNNCPQLNDDEREEAQQKVIDYERTNYSESIKKEN